MNNICILCPLLATNFVKIEILGQLIIDVCNLVKSVSANSLNLSSIASLSV